MVSEFYKLKEQMEKRRREEMRDGSGTCLLARKDIIKNYYEGYEQALIDYDQAINADWAIDLAIDLADAADELTRILGRAEEALDDCQTMEKPDAYAKGCVASYRRALQIVESLRDWVPESVSKSVCLIRTARMVSEHENKDAD